MVPCIFHSILPLNCIANPILYERSITCALDSVFLKIKSFEISNLCNKLPSDDHPDTSAAGMACASSPQVVAQNRNNSNEDTALEQNKNSNNSGEATALEQNKISNNSSTEATVLEQKKNSNNPSELVKLLYWSRTKK